ncbi:MAG: hypothetical protein ACK5XD_11680, partial [Acidobacteriota bacterium]
VLLRNVMERRRELALLRAVGVTGREVAQGRVLANVLLLGLGVGGGGGGGARGRGGRGRRRGGPGARRRRGGGWRGWWRRCL